MWKGAGKGPCLGEPQRKRQSASWTSSSSSLPNLNNAFSISLLTCRTFTPSYSHSVFTHFMSLLNSVTVHVKSYASYSIVNPGHIVDHIALIIAYNTVFCTLQVLNKPHLLILYPQCALWVYQALALSQIRTCLICVQYQFEMLISYLDSECPIFTPPCGV